MRSPTSNILIIQTAFIGDVILATSFIESVKNKYPNSSLHFLLRKGNESLLKENPHIDEVWVWDKKRKYRSLIELIIQLRSYYFEHVFIIQRFFTMGLFSLFLKSKNKVGFNKNPFSFFFTKKIEHLIPHKSKEGIFHEVQRNLQLLQDNIPPAKELRPVLYLSVEDKEKVRAYSEGKYIVLAPTSVWYTKQWHLDKWVELVSKIPEDIKVYLIGAPSDKQACDKIKNEHKNITNLCGQLSLRESGALMKNALRVLVNDSAPLHLASSVNAPTTAIFCSTITDFGYYPLSEDSVVIQDNELDCRPCGLHGKKDCPLGHFQCSENLSIEIILNTISF